MNDSIGDFMTEGRERAIKTVAVIGGLIVYLGALMYSGVHNWNLLVSGINGDMRYLAAVGVIALELSGIFLPLALHFWTHDHFQRIIAGVFYFATFALIVANMIIDNANNTGAILPGWLEGYKVFVAPAIPVLVMGGWSLIFLTDPHSKERAMIEGLRASTREATMKRVAARARLAEINAKVDEAAAIVVDDVVSQVLGSTMRRTAPQGVIDAPSKDAEQLPTTKNGNGHNKAEAARIFDADTAAPAGNARPFDGKEG